jgi:hypothetical protein
MVQLHKRFTDSQVKELIERYLRKEIERRYIQEVLGSGKTRFFTLINPYRAVVVSGVSRETAVLIGEGYLLP